MLKQSSNYKELIHTGHFRESRHSNKCYINHTVGLIPENTRKVQCRDKETEVKRLKERRVQGISRSKARTLNIVPLLLNRRIKYYNSLFEWQCPLVIEILGMLRQEMLHKF